MSNKNEPENIIYKGWKMTHSDFLHCKEKSLGEIFNYMCSKSDDYEMSLKG